MILCQQGFTMDPATVSTSSSCNCTLFPAVLLVMALLMAAHKLGLLCQLWHKVKLLAPRPYGLIWAPETESLLCPSLPNSGLGLGHVTFPLPPPPSPPHGWDWVTLFPPTLGPVLGRASLSPLCTAGWGPTVTALGIRSGPLAGSNLWMDQALPFWPASQKG